MAHNSAEPDAAAWAAAKKHATKYKRAMDAYFPVFEVKERGLKKWVEKARVDWIATGCPAGGPEFPPLDDPPKVLAWWMAHMVRPPAPRLFELAGQAAPAAEVQAQPATAAEKKTTPPPEAPLPPPPPPRAAINIADYASISFADAVQRQGRYVAAAMDAYEKALSRGGASGAELAQLAKARDSALETLRTCQRDFDQAEIARGDRVHLKDLQAELAPIFAHLGTSLVELLTARIGLPRARARILADEWFATLRDCRFTASAAPPPIETAATG